MPKPFRRDSIAINDGEPRVWDHVPASAVMSGDIIAEFGEVLWIEPGDDGSQDMYNPHGGHGHWAADEVLFVFHRPGG